MPPLPRIHVTALAELADQLRYAPADALRRDLERAEALAAEINEDTTYPEDWVIFRITGYRPELDSPAMIVGAALLADLSSLVERLCDAAGLGEDDARDTSTIEDLCLRWNVSRKTVDRYRRKGLPARRIRRPDGKARLAFTTSSVEGFEARHATLLERASAFTRIPTEIEAKMIRQAGAYRDRLGWSLNTVAARLAERHGRAHETVRRLLQRHEARAARRGEAIFDEAGPLPNRARRAIDRASHRAIEPGVIGARFARSRASIHRIVNEARAGALRELDIQYRDAPLFSRRDAPDVILGATAARNGLGSRGETELLAFIAQARATSTPDAQTELSRATAVQFLLRRARLGIDSLASQGPPATELDEIETSLRWATRLICELVRAKLGLLIRTLETRLGHPLDTMRSSEVVELVELALHELSAAAVAFDPTRGGRLAAPAGIAIDRAATRWLRNRPAVDPSRATPRIAAPIAIPDWTLDVSPWQGRLDPDRRIPAKLDELEEGAVIAAFYGFDGGPPRTLIQLADELGLTRMHAARRLRRAIRAARAHVRNG